MLFSIKSYLLFLLKSTNHHGVHSPFVFEFVTKCLYNGSNKSGFKTLNVLLKSVGYFKPENIEIRANTKFEAILQEEYPKLVFNRFPLDFIYLQNPDITYMTEILSGDKVHNESMILIANIHKNAQNLRNWRSIAQENNFRVSIDMFYCGALFVRQEQVKEHFTIRI
ncbi:hypothetical protein MTsPCn5_39050 [Croceitalea sp. MTPC5]|uniref:hypothetical protein n=1 Tax=Croceitalea sp. MTPC5 TaxID=3056565 RepID=UPI002B3E3217|nr:hypothetical protein MTsPCn5_39050 [Croceitalea sp. MTPC5]